MTIEQPNLKQAQPGAPITAQDWNAMIRAVKELRATLQNLRTQAPAGILVTVRDRDTRAILAPELIHAVYAVSVTSNTLMQPGQRAQGGDQAYLIPIDAPGEYEVTAEPTEISGYQQQTQRVTIGDDIALVDFLLWEQPREPLMPLVFGKTLREARAILEAAGIAVRSMLDAHGERIDQETWDAQYGNRLVIGTQPGAGAVVAGGESADILVAGRVEPVERRPVLVGEIAVARPTRLAITPDGGMLYVLGQGAAGGGKTSITAIDTRRRRVVTTIDTGSAPLLNLAFDPGGTRAYVSVILPEFGQARSFERDIDVFEPRIRVAEDTRTAGPFDATRGVAGEAFEAQPRARVFTHSTAAGLGGALNQLITETSVGAAFGAGVASLAAVNLAGALGQAVKVRGNQGAIIPIDTARHRVIADEIISTAPAVIYSLGISSDGRSVYGAAPAQRQALRIDLRSRRSVRLNIEGTPAFVDVVNDTAYITDVARNLLVRVRGEEGDSFNAGFSPHDLAASADERFAYMIDANVQTGVLARVDLANVEGQPLLIRGVEPRVASQDGFLLSGIDITPDGSRVCVAVEEGLAIVRTESIDPQTGATDVQIVKLGGAPAGVAVEQNADAGGAVKYAYVANFADNVVQIVDLTGADEPFVRTSATGNLFGGRLAELMTVPGINLHIAERLVLSGIQSIGDLSSADSTLIAGALETSETQATTLIQRAGRIRLTVAD
jgi:DNA-binding beta-propeller fold protein YncE